MTETRLVLIRHGEAQTHLDQVVGGHSGCTGLSDRGRRQAELLRDRLARTKELADAAALYASILPRAIETAQIIGPAVGTGELEVSRECGFCEQHTGEADGMTWTDSTEKFFATQGAPATGTPGGFELWAHRRWMTGGESWVEFMARAGTALHDVADRHTGETVVVTCHGGVIRAAFAAFGAVSLHMTDAMHNQNTGLNEWRRGTDGRWRLARHNDHAHLLGTDITF